MLNIFRKRRGRAGTDDEGRSCRRRRGHDLMLLIDGQKFAVVDWSLGGFRVEGRPSSRLRGAKLSGVILGGRSWPEGKFVGEVAWVKKDGRFGLRIIEISPEVFLAMADVKAC